MFTLPDRAAHQLTLTAQGRPTSLEATVLATIERVNAHPTKNGTMRRWFEAHNGATVTTVQVDRTRQTVWAPTGRKIDTSRPSYVRLDGSIRDYAGCRVLHSDETTLHIATEQHDMLYLIES